MAKTSPHLKKHQFKKGEPSANPQGSRLHNPVIRALRKMTLEAYREIVDIVLGGSLTDLKALAENKNSTALQVGIATSMMAAIKKGDYATIERIAERCIGKIPEVINVNSETNVHAQISVFDQAALKAAIAKIESDV